MTLEAALDAPAVAEAAEEWPLPITLAVGAGVMGYPGLAAKGVVAEGGSAAYWLEGGLRVWRIRVAVAMELDPGSPHILLPAVEDPYTRGGGRQGTLRVLPSVEFGRLTVGAVWGVGVTSGGFDLGVSGRWDLYTFPKTRLSVIGLGEVLSNFWGWDHPALMLRAGFAVEFNPAHPVGE